VKQSPRRGNHLLVLADKSVPGVRPVLCVALLLLRALLSAICLLPGPPSLGIT
jgi:hypothetical protein